jgi:hypothetical protein
MSNRRPLGPLAAALVLGGCAPHAESMLDPTAAPPPLARVAIAPTDEALTFARAGGRVLAVTRYEDGRVEGVDLAVGDPIALFLAQGYDALRERIDATPAGERVSVAARELGTPLDLRDHHVATGLNFPAHAGESGPARSPSSSRSSPCRRARAPRSPSRGASSTTRSRPRGCRWRRSPRGTGRRRWRHPLQRLHGPRHPPAHVDPWNPGSGKGFTTGKSFPGSLPVGDLFVIPRDARAFAAGLELRLWVNDRLRQRAPLDAITWKLDDLVAQTWARRELRWDDRGSEVRLPVVDGRIPDRTLVMSGTPDGTIFRAIAPGRRCAASAHGSAAASPPASRVRHRCLHPRRARCRHLPTTR